MFDDVLWFSWKNQKKVPLSGIVQYCLMSKWVLTKTTVAVFPRGSKKNKSKSDDKHDHGQEKRRPSTLCWGKNKIVQQTVTFWYKWFQNNKKDSTSTFYWGLRCRQFLGEPKRTRQNRFLSFEMQRILSGPQKGLEKYIYFLFSGRRQFFQGPHKD